MSLQDIDQDLELNFEEDLERELEDEPEHVGEAFRLRLSEDRVFLLLDCTHPGEDLGPLIAELAEELPAFDIPNLPDLPVLVAHLAEGLAAGEDLRDFVVVQGQPVERPVDGWIEWMDDFFATGFAVDEQSGAVNYWERRENRSVHADQLLARIHPPVQGRAGITLFGDKLAVRRAERALARAGKGVRKEECDGVLELYSELDGRLRWADNMLAVDNVYEVRGNVSLETGNIDHPGAVIIGGDIKTGATVKATGDIVVGGIVEPCRIEGGGNLTVQGGIIGGPEGRIVLGGDLQARYLLEATVDAGGNVVVTSEINQSRVRCGGKISIPRGRITGGEVMALAGIEVGRAGCEGLGKTMLASGIDYRLKDKLDAIERESAALLTDRSRLEEMLHRARVQRGVLDEQRLADAASILARRGEIDDLLEELAEDARLIRHHSRKLAKHPVHVFEIIHPDTTFLIRDARLTVAHTLTQPRKVTAYNGEVSIMPYDPVQETKRQAKRGRRR